MFKVNNRNTRTRCEICSKLTIKTPERRHWRSSDVFIVNFEHITHLVLVFLLLTLSRYMPAGKHCVNNLFVDAVQNSFSQATRSSIREYCGYTLKFAPDRIEAGRRSLSSIENVIDRL